LISEPGPGVNTILGRKAELLPTTLICLDLGRDKQAKWGLINDFGGDFRSCGEDGVEEKYDAVISLLSRFGFDWEGFGKALLVYFEYKRQVNNVSPTWGAERMY
jgi:hypothetical protein